MKNYIKFFLCFFTLLANAQVKKDTIIEKYTDIDTVKINNKDYEKVDYYFGLKQENNVRYIPMTYREEGVIFNNNLGKRGRVSNLVVFLHKTESKVNLTNLEINFYKVDSLTGKPTEKINTKQIVYVPQSKSRGRIKINVEDYRIPFPLNGIFASVKWLPNEFNDKKVGPSLRETDYEEQISFTRYKDGNWVRIPNISRKPNMYTNAMIGLEVYVKKRKKVSNE